MSHIQVPIKVNAFVDEGVAPLVSVLNRFENVLTLDSCENGEDGAYVLFRFAGDFQQAMRFAAELNDSLQTEISDYLLQVEWRPGYEEPLFALSCPSYLVANVAKAINER